MDKSHREIQGWGFPNPAVGSEVSQHGGKKLGLWSQHGDLMSHNLHRCDRWQMPNGSEPRVWQNM